MALFSRKAKHFITVTVKIIIVVIAFLFVWERLQKDWQSFEEVIINKIVISSLYLNITILLLFTIINWSLDAARWQTLVSSFKMISFTTALKQTLAAHVASFVTPVKTGEYGAKALYFNKDHRKKIVVLNFLGNMYQMLATLLFGLIGFGLVCFVFKPFPFIWYTFIVLGGLGVCLLIPRNLNRLRWSIKGYSWQRVRDYVLNIQKRLRNRAKALSFIKYLVFSHQFYFLLLILEIDISYLDGMALVASMYLLSSLVPVMQFFDVVVRGGAAVLLFGLAEVPASVILLITTTMWFLNAVLPLVPGSFFLFKSKGLGTSKNSIDTAI